MAVLQGHATGVIGVKIHEGLVQVFSYSKDAVSNFIVMFQGLEFRITTCTPLVFEHKVFNNEYFYAKGDQSVGHQGTLLPSNSGAQISQQYPWQNA